VYVLIRTQYVYNPAGNIFTGGLEEALFDLHIAKITNPDYRIGSPAAGTSSVHPKFLLGIQIFTQHDRWPTASRIGPNQIC
jgi:hypothetical protein